MVPHWLLDPVEHDYNHRGGRLGVALLFQLQWGSEYRTSLVIKWSKVVRSANGPLFRCHLNTGQVKVCYSDVSVIQMFVIQIPTVVELLIQSPSYPQTRRVDYAPT